MPKLKTHKGAKKRFRVTANSKVLRAKAGKSHILTKKSRKRKRLLRKPAEVSKKELHKVKQMLPYEF
ncbi:MAG: 50S ribosomal protein L35 [Candidatus Aminicenantia bacterium]